MYKKILLVLLLLFGLVSCSTGARLLNPDSHLVSDSGGLTRYEMEAASKKIAYKISEHFKANPDPKGVFLVMIPVKNETTEQIPTEIFENSLVAELSKYKIYTLRTDKRLEQLNEIKISQQLGQEFDLGELKSPNYFVRSRIDENAFRSDGKQIVEQVLNVELLNLASLVVKVSSQETYRKQAKRGTGVSW